MLKWEADQWRPTITRLTLRQSTYIPVGSSQCRYLSRYLKMGLAKAELGDI